MTGYHSCHEKRFIGTSKRPARDPKHVPKFTSCSGGNTHRFVVNSEVSWETKSAELAH